MNILKQVYPAFAITVVLTVLLGVIYPLAVTGLARLIFPRQAGGSLIEKDGKVIIDPDRATVLRAELLSFAALRGGKRLRRDGLGRHESWADQSETHGQRQGCRGIIAGRESRLAGTDRHGHGFRIRARSAYHPGGG